MKKMVFGIIFLLSFNSSFAAFISLENITDGAVFEDLISSSPRILVTLNGTDAGEIKANFGAGQTLDWKSNEGEIIARAQVVPWGWETKLLVFDSEGRKIGIVKEIQEHGYHYAWLKYEIQEQRRPYPIHSSSVELSLPTKMGLFMERIEIARFWKNEGQWGHQWNFNGNDYRSNVDPRLLVMLGVLRIYSDKKR